MADRPPPVDESLIEYVWREGWIKNGMQAVHQVNGQVERGVWEARIRTRHRTWDTGLSQPQAKEELLKTWRALRGDERRADG